MLESDTEYQRLVELKMIARAERNALLHQAEKDAEAEAAQEAQARQERARLEKLKQAEQVRLREMATQARRQLPALIGKFRADPAGIRQVEALRRVCLRCGSDRVQSKSANYPFVLVCQECWAEWYTGSCWSCAAGRVDSRDPETPPCPVCGRHKCAECGACRPAGCSTNPYTAAHRYQDISRSGLPEEGSPPDLASAS